MEARRLVSVLACSGPHIQYCLGSVVLGKREYSSPTLSMTLMITEQIGSALSIAHDGQPIEKAL